MAVIQGFEEKDAILRYIKELNPKEYTVIVNEYYNRENNPPIPAFILNVKRLDFTVIAVEFNLYSAFHGEDML